MVSFDWQKIFINDLTGEFALEIVFRTAFMFITVLTILRLSGKRGIRQLSIFELAIIIGLGSAAGDPMFNEDIAILPAVVVCVTAIAIYRAITWLTPKFERFERIVEGKPVYIVEDGIMVFKDDAKDSLSRDEFFAELRDKGVEHLGEVKTAILETNGNMSVFYYPKEKVKPGLPILPKIYDQRVAKISRAGLYACAYCGKVVHLASGQHSCTRCHHQEWVKAQIETDHDAAAPEAR